MAEIIKFSPAPSLFGFGVLAKLPEELKARSFKTILIITDPQIAASGILQHKTLIQTRRIKTNPCPLDEESLSFIENGIWILWFISKLVNQIFNESLARARKEKQIAPQASAGYPLSLKSLLAFRKAERGREKKASEI